MALYDSLFRWNLWGSWKIPPNYQRTITSEICRYHAIEEVIVLLGPRRAGKSTVLYQVMSYLLENNANPKSILHINFEEPALAPYLKLSLLDEIYDLYRSQVFPKGRATLFLDEIQNIPQWERWVRARNDTEDIKIFITGSSSTLLSGELASALTGRNLTFEIYPLSFSEVLTFKGISLPQSPIPKIPPPEIKYELIQYLQWGGFPRIVLANDDDERERLLKRYFDEIVFKDVVQRHQIRNVTALRNIAIHLITNTATLVSYKRLGDIFEVSADLTQAYSQYLADAFLIDLLSLHSLKASERTRHPFKVHAIDLGLRKVISLNTNRDDGKLLETQVHNTLMRQKKDGIFYWKETAEVDLLIQQGITITHLFQVAYKLDNKVLGRELRALQKAREKYPQAKAYLITWEIPENFDLSLCEDVEVLALWHFLLESF